MKLCECGCGQLTKLAKQSRTSRGWVRGEPKRFVQGHRPRHAGYRQVFKPDHPNAIADGRIKRHVLIASTVLGKPLPEGVEVHHVDGDKLNNANSNLVICQDNAYHKLLHARARLVRMGANPETHKICPRCRQALPIERFNKTKARRYGFCKSCTSEYKRGRNEHF